MKYSQIFQDEVEHALKPLLGYNSLKKELILCYRASEDGWLADDFHSRCDGRSELVIIFKTTENRVAGAYTDITLRSKSKFKTKNNNSFLFSLQEDGKFQ